TVSRLGYAAEADDRLVDALFAHSGPESVAAKVREHLAAGADHVTLLLSIGTEFAAGIEQLERLAPALAELE
ncbi:MAG TPA: LLM class flavin-dependent oxidoreductase, partial [Amycolatopsis sp.]|nr:LLM class flavin-dependent oxidoreductase [Amycolatopsis sp.]